MLSHTYTFTSSIDGRARRFRGASPRHIARRILAAAGGDPSTVLNLAATCPQRSCPCGGAAVERVRALLAIEAGS